MWLRRTVRQNLNNLLVEAEILWIFTLAHLKLNARGPDTASNDITYPKLFIVGCARSGTTWVKEILGAHPATITNVESHIYPLIFEPFQRLGFKSPRAWATILHRVRYMRKIDRPVGVHQFISDLAFEKLLRRAIGKLLATPQSGLADGATYMIGGVLDHFFFSHGGDGNHILVEKTPDHIDYAEHILDHFPEAKLIEVVRDGRDVCVSMQMRALNVNWPATDRSRQIEIWKEKIEKGLSLAQSEIYKDRILQVHYEQLHQNPETEIRRILNFAELGFDDELIGSIIESIDIERLPADKKGDGKHVRKGVVGDWRNHFSAEDEAMFKEKAGDLFERIGYCFD